MLTDKQIEREEAFCEDWYMTRKMEKTPTYADAMITQTEVEVRRKGRMCYASKKKNEQQT